MESFCKVGEGDSVVVDDLADGPNDTDMIVGIEGKTASANRSRKYALLSPAVDGVPGDIELTTQVIDRVHG
jgi:hypothetical protein